MTTDREYQADTEARADLADRMKSACNGRPATIAWPHRLLHEAAAEIERLRERVKAADALAEAVDHERNMVCQDMGMQLDASKAVDTALAAYQATGETT